MSILKTVKSKLNSLQQYGSEGLITSLQFLTARIRKHLQKFEGKIISRHSVRKWCPRHEEGKTIHLILQFVIIYLKNINITVTQPVRYGTYRQHLLSVSVLSMLKAHYTLPLWCN